MSVLEGMILRADMRCTVCGTSTRVGCSCWAECRCGRFYRRGDACPNPLHVIDSAAQELAADAVRVALRAVAKEWREPMRFASGGFRGQVRHYAERAISSALVEWSMDDEPDDPPCVNMGFVLSCVATYYPTPLADQAFRAALRQRLECEAAEIGRVWVEEAARAETR